MNGMVSQLEGILLMLQSQIMQALVNKSPRGPGTTLCKWYIGKTL